MRSPAVGAAVIAVVVLMGCSGGSERGRAVATSTTGAVTTDRLTPSTTMAPTTTTATTATTAAPAFTTTTTTTVPTPRTLVELARPAGTVAVFSDSMYADQTGDFQLFDLVRAGLLRLPVGADDVRNYAVPGQGLVDGLEIAEPGWHLLRSYLEARSGDPYLAELDLAIIASGRVDVNRLGRDAGMDELGPLLAEELTRVIAEMEARGTHVVLLPAFGANDELFDALQCRAAGRCEPQHSDAKFAALNSAFVEAGLPMLFDRYADTDLDEVPGTDHALFVDFDPTGRWPDDGQHPNSSGERLIAEQVLFHLAAAFGVDPLPTLPSP